MLSKISKKIKTLSIIDISLSSQKLQSTTRRFNKVDTQTFELSSALERITYSALYRLFLRFILALG